jgi:hypothetical protein
MHDLVYMQILEIKTSMKLWMHENSTLTALEGFVVGDAEVLEHVGVGGEQWRGEGQEGDAGGEEGSGELGHDFWLIRFWYLDQLCWLIRFEELSV